MTPVIEAARLHDAAEIDALIGRCSLKTRYSRFFAPVRAWPIDYRAGALAGDPDRHDAVVARLGPAGGDPQVIALASLVNGAAEPELGVLVEDGWQGRGIGSALTSALIRRGRARGLTRLRATVLPGAAHLIDRLGQRVTLERTESSGASLTAVFRLL